MGLPPVPLWSIFLFFDETAQPFQRLVPLRRDLLEGAADFGQALRLELPDPFAPGAAAAQESGAFEDAEMLRDRLPRHVGDLGETRRRERAATAETRDHAQARRVAERGEDRRGIGE